MAYQKYCTKECRRSFEKETKGNSIERANLRWMKQPEGTQAPGKSRKKRVDDEWLPLPPAGYDKELWDRQKLEYADPLSAQFYMTRVYEHGKQSNKQKI